MSRREAAVRAEIRRRPRPEPQGRLIQGGERSDRPYSIYHGGQCTSGIGRPRAVQARGGTALYKLSAPGAGTDGRKTDRLFSGHAMERAEERDRGDTQSSGPADGLCGAGGGQGATNILALDQSLAFIINVPNGRVITTMSPG